MPGRSRLVPELAENAADTVATLLAVNPALRDGVARAAAAWPDLLTIEQMLGAPGLAALADDAMLLAVLKGTTVRDVALERFLTSIRAAVLKQAGGQPDDDPALEFLCALARQCFNNEYVFAESPEQTDLVERQRASLIEALDQGTAIAPSRLVALASYRPLASLPDARRLLDRPWPAPVDELLTQQIRETDDEKSLREAMPRLTAIRGEGGAAVRQQYEENPYPRWVVAPSQRDPIAIDEYLKRRFPLAPFRPLGDRALDVLIAGCGTGEHSIGTARRFKSVNVLAIDFSLASLAYAQRKTRELGLGNVEYGQADVLEAGSIGRSFDVIDAGGVLHHLADPAAGWQALLRVLRPGGLMRVGPLQRARPLRHRRGPPLHRRTRICRDRNRYPAQPAGAAGRVPSGAGELSGFLQHQRMPRSAVSRAGTPVRHSADQAIAPRAEPHVPGVRIGRRCAARLCGEASRRRADDRSGRLGRVRAAAARDIRRHVSILVPARLTRLGPHVRASGAAPKSSAAREVEVWRTGHASPLNRRQNRVKLGQCGYRAARKVGWRVLSGCESGEIPAACPAARDMVSELRTAPCHSCNTPRETSKHACGKRVSRLPGCSSWLR